MDCPLIQLITCHKDNYMPPLKSLAQARLAFATKGGAKTNMPKKVAEEFIEATPKERFKKLKDKVRKSKS